MLRVVFVPREQCCARGSPNNIDWMSMTKVGAQRSTPVKFSPVIRPLTLALLCTALTLTHATMCFFEVMSRFLDAQMRILLTMTISYNDNDYSVYLIIIVIIICVFSQKLVDTFWGGRPLFSTKHF